MGKSFRQDKFYSVGKAFSIDLGSRLTVRLLVLALLTALTSAECTLSASGRVTMFVGLSGIGSQPRVPQ